MTATLMIGATAWVGRSVLAQPASAAPSTTTAPAAATASATLPPDPIDAPTLAEAKLPTERSKLPKRDEWATASLVAVTQRGARGRRCTAELLREYVRVRCPMVMAGARQLAGGIEDVELWITPKGKDATGALNLFAPPNGGDVVFPLRKGQSYLFRFFEVVEGYEGFGVGDGVIVDVSWPTSRTYPTVVVR